MSAKIKHEILNEVLPASLNPKDHDIGALIESIRTFGFMAPLLVNEHTGRLLAGHGRAEALLQMWSEGEDPPDNVTVDSKTGQWIVPVIRGVSIEDEKMAEAYLIADNRLTELGGWDKADLASMLRELQSAGVMDATGFDGDDLDELLADLGEFNVDPLGENPELPTGGKGDFTQISFTLTQDQAETVRAALKVAKEQGATDVLNTNKNGNALAYVAAAFMQVAVDG